MSKQAANQTVNKQPIIDRLEGLLRALNRMQAESDEPLPFWVATNVILMDVSLLTGESIGECVARMQAEDADRDATAAA